MTPDQAKQIFDYPVDRCLPSKIAHWTYDGQFNDVSGNNNHGSQSSILASMAFSHDGRLFYTEKNSGNVRIMQNDTILASPFATVSDVYVHW